MAQNLLYTVSTNSLINIKRDFMKNSLTLASAAVALALAGGAQAGVITNESTLLNVDDVTQLSAWLGKDVDLTRVFYSQEGDGQDSYDWHAASDGVGATFTVVYAESIVRTADGGEETVFQTVGGYNHWSWASDDSEILSTTANNFLFNLTTGSLYTANYGATTQAINDDRAAAWFGYNDFKVFGSLDSALSNFGEFGGDLDNDIGGIEGWFPIYSLETFTISDAMLSAGTNYPDIDDGYAGTSASTGGPVVTEGGDVSGGGSAATDSGLSGGSSGSPAFEDVDVSGQGSAVDVPAPIALAGLAMFGLMGFRRKS
jgi:hypothetical protein